MLFETISKDYITAMKAKDKELSSTLNFLRAQLKNVMIEKRSDSLSDEEVLGVIKKQVKQRLDSIDQYEQGGRDDLAQKERVELGILRKYLPEEMSEQEVGVIVEEAVKEAGASSMKDMGMVMKIVLAKIGSRADGKVVSNLVKKRLSET